MAETDSTPTGTARELSEAQKKAVAFLTRPPLRFAPAWYAAREAAAQKEAEEEKKEAEKEQAKVRIGDPLPDGTIYAGISPDTHQRMYATPADAPLTMKFIDAVLYASRLHAHDHKDWRVPTKTELDVLFQNREKGALRKTFNSTGYFPAGYYWSSTEGTGNSAWNEAFHSGHKTHISKKSTYSVRCVRS